MKLTIEEMAEKYLIALEKSRARLRAFRARKKWEKRLKKGKT